MSHCVIVASSGLHLREIASTAGHVIDSLNHGDELSVIGERTSISGTRWLRVHVLRTGDQGWVDASYTRVKPETPLPPTAHRHPPPLHKPAPKPDWSVPAPSWDIPQAPLPTKAQHWVWPVAVFLIIAATVYLFW